MTTARGTTLEFGDGTGGPVAVRFTCAAAEWAVLLDPELAVGESYMDGTLVVEQGSIADFLLLAMSQEQSSKPPFWGRPQWLLRYLWRRLAQFNPRGRARNNVAHHYDLDQRLYALFLDADRQYSCAYFEHPEQSLDDAQLAKKRHIAAKLLPRMNHRVLDIGSGWGGLALYLAEMCGARVTGVTLSDEQFALARNRADEKGLAGRIEFRLQDYRDIAEQFDRIVSVGMFEHVGRKHYGEFFAKCRELLKPDGVMLLHTIGLLGEPASGPDPFTDKYVFPGYHLPSLSEMVTQSERVRLMASDVETLRLHYAYTLRHWLERATKARAKIEALYDARFFRMWEFYLAGGIVMFESGAACNYQIQYVRDRNAVPITRDYMIESERRYRELGAKAAELKGTVSGPARKPRKLNLV